MEDFSLNTTGKRESANTNPTRQRGMPQVTCVPTPAPSLPRRDWLGGKARPEAKARRVRKIQVVFREKCPNFAL
jgi:hypothetical protein